MAEGTVSSKTLSAEEIHKLVHAIVLELKPDPNSTFSDEARLVDDLGYHSLALLELAFALEDEFELQPIDEPTARKIRTVKDIENHILGELQSSGRLVSAPPA